MPWAKSFCPFRACGAKLLLPLQGAKFANMITQGDALG
nr:MAG TPA: hypothetical protein [Caudoviricetes sp.]